MNLQFFVDKELCIGCEECVKDCPMGCIEMEGGFPVVGKENGERCLQCQHCLAVCSTGALSILGKNPADSLDFKGAMPTVEQMTALMKGRRSVRRYRKEPVSSGDITALLETVAYAPTAVNNRQVMLTVLEDPDSMDDMRKEVYAALEAKVKNGTLPAGMEFYLDLISRARAAGRDAIFQNAPHLLIASSPKNRPSAAADCFIALGYFELLAASMGLGTLWCGLAKWALTVIAPEALKRLRIPESQAIVYTMLFGKPAVSYARTVQRDNPAINRVRQI